MQMADLIASYNRGKSIITTNIYEMENLRDMHKQLAIQIAMQATKGTGMSFKRKLQIIQLAGKPLMIQIRDVR